MKKILIIVCVAVSSLVSCTRFDDVALWNKTMRMESRILTLEELCEQMNTDISSLQTLIYALQENDYITAVTPVYNGSVVIGYTIDFIKSPSITIYHGQNGADGHTPQIGIRQDADGHYYWTLDGDWLLGNGGQKILAEGNPARDGKDGVTPQLKIEDRNWYVSTDNGQTWNLLGSATGENGDSFFKSVDISNSNYITFVLADGTEFKVPRYSALSIEFDVEGPVTLLPHSNLKIGYTIITEETSNLSIEAISSADLKVTVSKTTETTGTLDIISGESVDEFSRVIVLVSNGEKTIMKSISFGETFGLRVTNGLVREVSAAGEDVEIKVETNMEYVVSIPESDKGWISHVSTRAWHQESIFLTVAENKGSQRSSLIDLKDETGHVWQSVQIIQSAASSSSDSQTKIYYTSTDGNIVKPFLTVTGFDANIINNTYVNNQGVIEFDKVVTSITNAFYNCTNLAQISIPNSVTSIGKGTFKGCSNLQQITLSDKLESIGEEAFRNCSSLTQITIPNSVTSIGEGTFQGCSNLQQITLSDKLESIGRYAFSNCTKLAQISIPNSVTSIEEGTFFLCSNLQQISIPNSVTSIGHSAFYFCTNLQQISIPNSVASIGHSAFYNCSSLQQITLPDKLGSIEADTFNCCAGLAQISIPNSVTSIGKEAFQSCSSLAQITIPDSVTSIGNNTFFACWSLANIYCRPTVPPELGSRVFPEILQIYVPQASVDTYKSANNWSEYASKISGYDF